MSEKNSEARVIGLNELERLSSDDRIQYFNNLRGLCKERQVNKKTNSMIVKAIGKTVSKLRPYDLEIEGTENITTDNNVIFLCNHSNAHDMFTVFEVFYKLGKPVTPLAAWDGLNCLSRFFFRKGDTILLKRNDAESIASSMLDFCSCVLKGKSGFIFGEATWNMHPTKPMQNLHAGVTEIALITGKRIVPMIFEYVEVDHMCKKEANIYKKCIVSFGKPVTVKADESIFGQTDKLQETMSSMREELWEREGIKKSGFTEDDIKRYINHTYLKKYKAFGFKYNTNWESQFLLTNGQNIENEYCLDEEGKFVPGICIDNVTIQKNIS